MISRVAESLYWMQRYVERAASMARILQTTSAMLDVPAHARWGPVIIVAGEQPNFYERFGPERQEEAETVQHFLTWDAECPASIFNSLRAARENARTSRETVSREVFEALNHAWLWFTSERAQEDYAVDRDAFYGRVRALGHEVRGAALATMLRDEPLDFMELGLMLERAGQTARALDVKHHAVGSQPREGGETAADTVAWISTLLSCTAYEGYFKRYRGSVRGRRVAAFLLLDPAFPRSVRACVGEALRLVDRVKPAHRPMHTLSCGLRLAGLKDALEQHDVDGLIERGIHEVLTEIVDGLSDIHSGLYSDFFNPVVRPSRAEGEEPQ